MKTFKPMRLESRINWEKIQLFCHDIMAGFGLGMMFFCLYLIIEPFVR
jgi:hypothetical protein